VNALIRLQTDSLDERFSRCLCITVEWQN